MAWQTHQTEDGRTYYFNELTCESTWDVPREMLTPTELALLDFHWTEHETDTQQKYWYNKESQESVWDLPENVVLRIKHYEEQLKAGIKLEPPGDSGKTGNRDARVEDGESPAKKMRLDEGDDVEIAAEIKNSGSFNNVLKSANITENSTWDEVLDTLVTDSGYWSVTTSVERKELFDNYVRQLKNKRIAASKEARKSRLTKIRSIYMQDPWKSRIEKAVRLNDIGTFLKLEDGFFDTDLMKSLSKVSKDVIEYSYALYKTVDEITKQIETQNKALSKSASEKLMRLLPALNITSLSKFELSLPAMEKAISQHNDNLRLSDEPRNGSRLNYRGKPSKLNSDGSSIDASPIHLDRLSILQVFKRYTQQLEKAAWDQWKVAEQHAYRRDRKVREKYQELLITLDLSSEPTQIANCANVDEASRSLSLATKWGIAYKSLKDDERYQEMATTNGCKAVELFWESLETESTRVTVQRDLVFDLLLSKNYDLANLTMEKLQNLVANDNKAAVIDSDLVPRIWDTLKGSRLAPTASASSSSQTAPPLDNIAQNRLRIMQDEFYLLLKEVNPPIQPDEDWEVIRRSRAITASIEFQALPNNESKQAVFVRYIRRRLEAQQRPKAEDGTWRRREQQDRGKERYRNSHESPREYSRDFDRYHERHQIDRRYQNRDDLRDSRGGDRFWRPSKRNGKGLPFPPGRDNDYNNPRKRSKYSKYPSESRDDRTLSGEDRTSTQFEEQARPLEY